MFQSFLEKREGTMVESRVNEKQEMMKRLLWGELYDTGSFSLQAYLNELGLLKPHRVLVVDLISVLNDEENIYEQNFDVSKVNMRIKAFIADLYIDSDVIFMDGPDGALVIVSGEDELGNPRRERSFRIAESICGYIATNESNISVIVGIGKLYKNFSEIWKSYQEAKKSVNICERVWGRDRLAIFEDLGIYRFISAIDSLNSIEDYYQDTVGKLLCLDEGVRLELIKTLKMYIKCNESIKEAANALYIHPNTIRYRFTSIKKITGLDPFISEERIELCIGLKIMPLLHYKGSRKR